MSTRFLHARRLASFAGSDSMRLGGGKGLRTLSRTFLMSIVIVFPFFMPYYSSFVGKKTPGKQTKNHGR